MTTDQFSDLFDENVDQEKRQQSGKEFRQQFEKLLAENKVLKDDAAKRADAEDAVAYKTKLEEKGLTQEDVEGLIPADLAGSERDSWIDRYAERIGAVKEVTPEPLVEQQGGSVVPKGMSQEDVAEVEAFHAAQPAGHSTLPTDVQSKLDSITSEEELMEYFRSQGGDF